MRTRICYFAKFRPLMFTSDLLVDRSYFVVIKLIVFSVVVVSLRVDSSSDYVVCAVAAEGDNVFRRRDGLFHSGFELRSHRDRGATAFRPRYDLFDSC